MKTILPLAFLCALAPGVSCNNGYGVLLAKQVQAAGDAGGRPGGDGQRGGLPPPERPAPRQHPHRQGLARPRRLRRQHRRRRRAPRPPRLRGRAGPRPLRRAVPGDQPARAQPRSVEDPGLRARGRVQRHRGRDPRPGHGGAPLRGAGHPPRRRRAAPPALPRREDELRLPDRLHRPPRRPARRHPQHHLDHGSADRRLLRGDAGLVRPRRPVRLRPRGRRQRVLRVRLLGAGHARPVPGPPSPSSARSSATTPTWARPSTRPG